MKIKIVVDIVILVALGWITWPYYALYDFANGMQQGDQVALERRVAWDEVRRGLRDDLNAGLLGLIKNDGTSSPLATGLVALVGPTIINNAIDSYVTPRGIANLIRSGKPSIPNVAQTENSATDQSSASRFDDKQQDRLHWEQVRYAFFSGGPLTFRVDITQDNAQSGQRPVTLLFKWAGDWKLSRLFLPLDPAQNTHAGAEPPRKETQGGIQSRREVEARAAKELLSVDEIGALRARLAKLWKIPAGAKSPEELIVRIRFQLNRDRTIAGSPVVLTAGTSPLFLASRDSALRALNAAQPFTMLRPEHYEEWKEIEITFDPRETL
jgi:Protein of unknown function (DUF2939)